MFIHKLLYSSLAILQIPKHNAVYDTVQLLHRSRVTAVHVICFAAYANVLLQNSSKHSRQSTNTRGIWLVLRWRVSIMEMRDSMHLTLWLHIVSVTDQDICLSSIHVARQLLCQNMPKHVQQNISAQ